MSGRTLMTGLTADQQRAIVTLASEVVSGDPDRVDEDLLEACSAIVDNYREIVDEALERCLDQPPGEDGSS